MDTLVINTELIGTAFEVEWVEAEVEEMHRKLTGDVKRAEVAERATTRTIRKFISTR
jgi:N-acetylglutamate synthase/N-acetylornithine aminotransferase